MFVHHVWAVSVVVVAYLGYKYGWYKAVKAEAAKVEAAVKAEVKKVL